MVVLPLLGGVGQVAELPAHHLGAADDAVDHCLVDRGPEPRSAIASQDLLPGQADFKQALDLIRVQLYRPVPEDIPRVVRRLQQARHDHGLEVADRGGAGFQADVDLVRVRQHVAERVPPPGLAGLLGQLDQPVPFGPGHAVQLEKDPNVPRAGGGSVRSRCGTGSTSTTPAAARPPCGSSRWPRDGAEAPSPAVGRAA